MTRAQILRKKAGTILAIIGIALSMLPAVRLADGTKLFIFQIIGNDYFFKKELTSVNEMGAYIVGILLCVMLIGGLLIHVLNLFLWTRKTEKTYLGVMALSWGSFLGMIMTCAVIPMIADDFILAVFPYTIWQAVRIIVILAEAIMKLHGEELINVFFPEK